MKQKENSKLHPFFYFLLMTAFGCLLLWKPNLTPEMVIRILGGGFTVGGLILIVGYIRSSGGGDSYLRLFGGILVIAGGIFILFRPADLVDLFPMVMGAIILLNGFLNMTRSLDYMKTRLVAWRLPLVMALISMALGLGILFIPFHSSDKLLKALGVVTIYNAFSSVWIHTRRPKKQKHD